MSNIQCLHYIFSEYPLMTAPFFNLFLCWFPSCVCFLNLMVRCVKKKDFFLKLAIDHFIRTRQVFWNILYILCFYIDKTILISLNCLLPSSNLPKNTCLHTGTWMLLEFCLHYPSGVPRTNNDSQTCYKTHYYK